MHRFLKLISCLIVLGFIFLLAVIFVPVKRTGPLEALNPDDKPGIAYGKYVAEIADCEACHTRPGGEDYSGGLKVESPFGTIYAANITPDKENGIGNWTLDQFRDALRDGIGKDARLLYPAMPYENYRAMSEKDITALYNYMMNGVAPVSYKAETTNLAFPFNQRWGIRMWNWFAIPGKAGFEPLYDDPQLNRGAYIVESLAHCGACHTPRDIIFRQSAKTALSNKFLTGQVIDDWYAPDLRGSSSSVNRWSTQDLEQFLKNGRNSHAGSVGPMELATEESLQFASDEDIKAISAYLKHVAMPVTIDTAKKEKLQEEADKTTALLTEADPAMPLGARLYIDNCNACHFANGKGSPNVFPELALSSIVNAPNPSGLLQVIIGGAHMPSTAEQPSALAMPGFGWRMNDVEIATLANFLRTAWGNNASVVAVKQVEKARKKVGVSGL